MRLSPVRPVVRMALMPVLVWAWLALSGCDQVTLDPQAGETAAPVKPAEPVGPLPSPALDIAAREFTEGTNRLGINLPPVFSWSNTPMYTDLMHQARRFGTPAMPWDERALLGEDGWPVGEFGIFLMSSQGGLSTNGGHYTVRFKGEATVRLVASRGTLGTPQFDTQTGITTIDLELPDHADQLALAFTQTRGSIKDLRVIRPGYDASHPPLFTREFLEHIAPFKVVRLMDWLRTNNQPVARWPMRSTEASVHYASEKGVPWEHAIELARVAGKDLWINVPAQADDDYVHQLARLMRDALPPETKLYVEYSNEVWNSMFSQSRENLAAAKAEMATDRDSPLGRDGQDNPDIWKYRRIPQRAMEISDIFRSEFGDAAMMTRVRPVYAVQIVNTWITEQALDYMAKVHGPPSRYFYAIAGAPYFNMGPRQRDEGLTADQVLASMGESVDAMPAISHLEKNLSLSHWYQLPFIAYEGGADTFGPGSLAAKKAAALDPRMEALCRRHLDTWHTQGGGLFMWFHAGAGNWSTPYGTWELTTDLAVTDTPKIRCMKGALGSPAPALHTRNTLPGIVDALAYAGNAPPYSPKSAEALRQGRPGGRLDYLVQAPHAGRYRLTLTAQAYGTGNQVQIATAFGSTAGSLALADTGRSSSATSAPIEIWLREGLNTLRLSTLAVSGGYELKQLTFEAVNAP